MRESLIRDLRPARMLARGVCAVLIVTSLAAMLGRRGGLSPGTGTHATLRLTGPAAQALSFAIYVQ
jgi:hypothetical protein